MTTAVLLVFLGALSRLIPSSAQLRCLSGRSRSTPARACRARGPGSSRSPPWRFPMSCSTSGGAAPVTPVRLTIYATFAGIVLGGRASREGPPPPSRRLFRRRLGALLRDVQPGGVGRQSDLPEDPRGPRALLRARRSRSSGQHARRGPPGHRGALRPRRAGAAAAHAPLAAAARPSSARSARTVLGQQVPPASERIVVTATSVPEDEKEVGSAITVITREEIEKHESAGRVGRPARGARASTSPSTARPARSPRSSRGGPTRRRRSSWWTASG